MDERPIDKAIRLAGSEAKLGVLAGFSQVAIHRAKHRGRCSAEMALGIDHGLQGVVSASELRPDLWARPEDVPRSPPPAAPMAGEGAAP